MSDIRMELVNKIQALIEETNAIEEEVKALESSYHKNVSIEFLHNTDDFNHKGSKQMFEVSKNNLLSYLKKEHTDKSKELNELTNKLMGMV